MAKLASYAISVGRKIVDADGGTKTRAGLSKSTEAVTLFNQHD